MKTDILAFKIVVDKEGKRAVLICITYKLSNGEDEPRGRGAEFYELTSSFDNSLLKEFDEKYNLTFWQELRMYGYAASIAPNEKGHIMKWVKIKMEGAYSRDAKIIINEFKG